MVVVVKSTMNFLSRSSQTNEVPPAAATAAIEIADRDNRVSESSASSLPASAALVGLAGAENSSGAGEDARGFNGSSANMRTRMAIQDHSDLLPDEGSILIPFSESLSFCLSIYPCVCVSTVPLFFLCRITSSDTLYARRTLLASNGSFVCLLGFFGGVGFQRNCQRVGIQLLILLPLLISTGLSFSLVCFPSLPCPPLSTMMMYFCLCILEVGTLKNSMLEVSAFAGWMMYCWSKLL